MENTSEAKHPFWKRLSRGLAHAFTVPAKRHITDEEKDLLQSVSEKITEKRLATPALFLLESLRPLHYTGSQLLIFLRPVFRLVVDTGTFDRFVSLMERQQAVDYLAAAIEERTQ